jgi:serine/threonine-protein kinase
VFAKQTLRAGLVLPGGRYLAEEPLAQGGNGEVWVGLDVKTGRRVALKTLRPVRAVDERAVEAFKAEATAALAVHHPAVVRTYQYVPDDDGPGVIVQQLVRGVSLASEVRRQGPMAPARALRLLAQIARGLRAIHLAGYVHRDVSTVNIVLEPQDRPVLIDFGIATPIGSQVVTLDMLIPGNPDYLAPELARGKPATEVADIYSLGIVLLECLMGTKPFTGMTPELIATAHVLRPAPAAPSTLPADLRAFIALMVDKDPTRRPANALAVARLMETWAHQLGVLRSAGAAAGG